MSDLQKKESRAKWLWAGIIVALLGGHMTIMITAAYLALSDRSHAVMPNYYEKAVKWDEIKAQKQASESLGWQAVYHFDAPDVTGQRQVIINIFDQNDQPIENMIGQIEYYSHKQAGHVLTSDFKAGQPLTIKLQDSGLWNFSLVSQAIIDGKPAIYIDERKFQVKDWRASKIVRF